MSPTLQMAVSIRNNNVARFCEECVLWRVFRFHLGASYTEDPKYYARLQTAVARDLGCPAGPQAGPHTDAALKHSLTSSRDAAGTNFFYKDDLAPLS